MATIRQQRLVKKLRANEGKSAGQLLKEVGYSNHIIKNPKKVLQSKGVLGLFAKAGITPERIADEYNELLKLKTKDDPVSPDQKRKLLDSLTRIVIESPESKANPKYQFIGRFIQLNKLEELGLNKSKMARFNEPEIIEDGQSAQDDGQV